MGSKRVSRRRDRSSVYKRRGGDRAQNNGRVRITRPYRSKINHSPAMAFHTIVVIIAVVIVPHLKRELLHCNTVCERILDPSCEN